jgi:hypothetical protein
VNTRLGLRVFRFIAGYAVPPGTSFVVSPKRSLRCPSVGRAGRSRTVECLGRRGVAAGEREEGLPALGPDPIRDDDASSSNLSARGRQRPWRPPHTYTPHGLVWP